MKTFVLTVSRVFPCTHKRKGEKTYFKDKIEMALGKFECGSVIEHDTNTVIEFWPKLHTIRANKKGTAFENWSKKVKQIQKGEAILSIRYWSGKPYQSKQVEICQLDKDSGIGVQKIEFVFSSSEGINMPIIELVKGIIKPEALSKNDGLSLEDFKEWFKGYDLSKPMAIIHFTKFRY